MQIPFWPVALITLYPICDHKVPNYLILMSELGNLNSLELFSIVPIAKKQTKKGTGLSVIMTPIDYLVLF